VIGPGFDPGLYLALRQTQENQRAIANIPWTLAPQPQPPSILVALERAAQLKKPFVTPPPLVWPNQSAAASPQQMDLGFLGLGKVWEAVKPFVSVTWRAVQIFGNVVSKAALIWDAGKLAYKLSQWNPYDLNAARPPVVYSSDTLLNYYLQNDGSYKPGIVKMQ
jgi:hypothetical protein